MLKKTTWKVAGPGTMLSLALLGFVAPASAQSADTKGYSPTMCIPGSSGLDATYSLSYVYPNSSGYLYCPAVKDRYGSSANGQVAYVHVRDNNFSYNISCYLYLKDSFGGTDDWDSESTSGTPGEDQLVMSVYTGANLAFSTYAVSCYFPTNGSSNALSLTSYSMYELNTYD